MTSSLRHDTVETSREIASQLYTLGREEFFSCHIKINVGSTLKLDIKRVPDEHHSYETANGDRIYKSKARFHGDSREFDVDVVIHSRQASQTGATLLLSNSSLDIFTSLVRRLDLGK